MPSPHFHGSPEYIETHLESLKQLVEMWDDYTAARKVYAESLLSFNFKNAGMNNAEENMISGNTQIREAHASYLDAKASLRGAHNFYKSSYSALVQGKRL